MANTQEQLAQQRAAANADFLLNSYKTSKAMNAQNGNVFGQGTQLAFTSPILPGWAAYMRVFYNLTVNIALGAGAAAVNAGAPYNIFSNVQVDFSGANHRNHSGYMLKVLQQLKRGMLDLDASKAWANALVSSALPVANGNNSWIGYVDVPLQIVPTGMEGHVPIGESATPLTLRLTCNPSFVGADPYANVIALSGGAALTSVTGTITAAVYYRFGQSAHSPANRPSMPYIGSFLKIVEQATAVNSNANNTITELRQPFPHLYVIQAIVIPNAATKMCDSTQIGSVKFDLDPTTVMQDYSPSGAGFAGKVVDMRELYHGDLDEGVIVHDFFSGSMPEVPNGLNTPNIGNYNAAQTEILYSGALAANNNRIQTAACFLETLPY